MITNVLVDNLDGDTGALGHNTDGFDLSADDVTLTGNTVYNQDDWSVYYLRCMCLAR